MKLKNDSPGLKKNVGIIGLGYVGLPLAVSFTKAGFSVTGFDVDKKKVESLKRKVSYVPDVPSASLSGFKVTTVFSDLKRMDSIIICVPTPLRKSKDPDISYILSALDKIIQFCRKGQLIVLESTTYPGTTRDVILPAFEKKKFTVGKDIFLAFSPERVDPGNKKFQIRNTPKIVGGVTKKCTELATQLYGAIVDNVVPVSSPECAEMVKLLENTFRAVNIGLVNEVALMCDRLKLDTWEVIDAAATKPFGFMPFYPGPGIGGHCIPLDPQYLSWKLKSLNFYSRFIELAGEMNSKMPDHVIEKINDSLNRDGKSINNAKILLIGVAYKKDVNDVRESPALDVLELLRQKQAKLWYFDPYVPSVLLGGLKLKSVSLSAKFISRMDCVVITTNHSNLDMDLIVKNSQSIVDCRNATKAFQSPKIIKL